MLDAVDSLLFKFLCLISKRNFLSKFLRRYSPRLILRITSGISPSFLKFIEYPIMCAYANHSKAFEGKHREAFSVETGTQSSLLLKPISNLFPYWSKNWKMDYHPYHRVRNNGHRWFDLAKFLHSVQYPGLSMIFTTYFIFKCQNAALWNWNFAQNYDSRRIEAKRPSVYFGGVAYSLSMSNYEFLSPTTALIPYQGLVLNTQRPYFFPLP